MRRPALAALALVAGLAGCGDSRLPGPIRLVGDPGIRREGVFLTWGTVVTIEDMPRPVISAARPVIPPATLGDLNEQGNRKVSATIPPEFGLVPWFLFQLTVTRPGGVSELRNWPVTSKLAGSVREAWAIGERVGPDGVPGIRLWPVPDLATRDVETGDVAVPARAELTMSIGIERVAWDSAVIPIDMAVTAVAGGRETVVSTTRVDVRRPEFRQWVDVTAPLDAVAGQTVRFRFTARPAMGPTALVSLPVWGDPTIVETP